MPDPSHRSLNPTQNRHDAFFELMATSIVSELMYFYIPLGLVPMKVASSAYNHLQIYRAIVTVATSPLPAYYDRTFPLLMGLVKLTPILPPSCCLALSCPIPLPY